MCSTISQILKEGVDGDGGAKNAYVAGYSIAAKTGTSEKKDKFDEQGNTSYRVSSCIAYAPSEDAQVAVIIMVDEPTIGSKYGSVVAAPYVANLLELILPYLGVKAEYNEEDKEHKQILVPNLEGEQVKEAIERLNLQKIKFEIVGNGDVVNAQIPKAGNVIYESSGKVILYTGKEISETVIMPKIVGLSASEANKILINSGLNVKIEGAENFKYGQGAVVLSQSYSEGVLLAKGTIVTIKIMFTEDRE